MNDIDSRPDGRSVVHSLGSVLIFDPNWLVRNGLKHALTCEDFTARVFEAKDLDEANQHIENKEKFDIIVGDLMGPEEAPLEVLRAMQQAFPNVPLFVISQTGRREDVLQAIDLGASAFIPKSANGSEIRHAIKAVKDGEIYISKMLLDKPRDPKLSNGQSTDQSAGQSTDQARRAAIDGLTQRQKEVLEQLSQGFSNRSIADNLKVSEHTVKIHVAAILKALKVENRTQAALFALPPQVTGLSETD